MKLGNAVAPLYTVVLSPACPYEKAACRLSGRLKDAQAPCLQCEPESMQLDSRATASFETRLSGVWMPCIRVLHACLPGAFATYVTSVPAAH